MLVLHLYDFIDSCRIIGFLISAHSILIPHTIQYGCHCLAHHPPHVRPLPLPLRPPDRPQGKHPGAPATLIRGVGVFLDEGEGANAEKLGVSPPYRSRGHCLGRDASGSALRVRPLQLPAARTGTSLGKCRAGQRGDVRVG